MRAVLAAAFLLAVGLAGCADDSGDGSGDGIVDEDEFQLKAGRGAISGLLIDDRFRPIPGGLVLLQETGATTTTNENGEFQFLDLEPGTFTLRVDARGHEASPQTVDVAEGVFAEANLVARRIVVEGSQIITTEYSVFIPCGFDAGATGYVLDCTGDQSGDSFRSAFDSDYRSHGDNATYLVTEMRANKESRYEIQVREQGNGERYQVARIEGDYAKLTLQYGFVDEEHNGQNRNVAWVNEKVLETILFGDSPGREEFESVDPVGVFCCGVWAYAGIKAQFVQSLFLGEPEVDVASYCTIC